MLSRLAGPAFFVLLQGVWLLCVGGAARGWFWLGPLAVLLLIAGRLLWVEDRSRELRAVLVLGAVGTVVDSALSAAGLLRFTGPPPLPPLPAWVAPAWVIALWLHFGVMARTALAGLRRRPLLAALLGAVAGPLAYSAGVRWGAASFHPQTAFSLAALAVLWAAVVPLALAFVHQDEADRKGETQ